MAWIAIARLSPLGVALLLLATGAQADDVLDLQGGALYDSNLSRAQYYDDIKSDTAFQAALAWGRFVPLSDSLTMRATLDAAGEIYARYSGLDNMSVGGSVSLRRKSGLGAFAPWVGAAGSAARLEYKNSVRDGWRYEIGVGAGKRITEAWDVEASFRYQHRTADHNVAVAPGISGAVFDLQSHQAGLRSEYALTQRVSIAAGYDQRRGDVASTTLRNFTIYTNSDAIAPDPVFGPDTVGYRIYAITRAWRAGASYALGTSNSINLTGERWISRARGGLDYYNTLIGVSYVHAL
jgi:hypothetical protein